MDSPVVVGYGGGTNSTALLIEMVRTGERIDLILFADTGGEKPHTYEYVDRFDDWLLSHGAPGIIKVKKGGRSETLEENCLRMTMLPSKAYGYSGCSHKYKIEPKEQYINNWTQARTAWDAGTPVTNVIGFDADEPHRASIDDTEKYHYRYPLIEWDWGRDECLAAITAAGLCLPGKSACFFCPSSTLTEIRQLEAVYPDLARRALAIEKNAALSSVKGLGRRFSWANVLATGEMFPDDFAVAPELACGCYDGEGS